MEFYGHLIGGAEVESADGRRFDSVDPWTQGAWSQIASGGTVEVDRAVAAARTAFHSAGEGAWPRMSCVERGRILHRLADLIEQHGEQLALAETRDMGKPVNQASGSDIPRAAEHFRFFADHVRLSENRSLPQPGGHHVYTSFAPAGVVAAIAPWNFPLMLGTWKVAPALAWGNTVVLKPAEGSPVSAALLGRLALEAGIPPGVLNVVHGYGDPVGQALVEHPDVARITFTGSTATGQAISHAAATHLTPLSLELGGKNANIIFSDADLGKAVEWSLRAAFTNAGQVCLAGSRIYAQREIFDEFSERLVASAEQMTIGDPKDHGTGIGPLSSTEHYAKVCGYIDSVESSRGKILTGGRGDGLVLHPTVITGLPHNSPHCREEIFGPVVTLLPFDSEDEVTGLANDSRYGLTATLFTEDLSRAHRVADALNAGTVWVNCFFVRDFRAPFGGTKHSGVGREGGDFSRDFFTEPKTTVVNIDREPR